ncbi:Dienelactone hydrolase [Niveomyces insectorum RCEF 264]|uniref:Dienelactone hydrolase n=1 Tax=Niveomyces insectorum RCEF 264 TaxID=1081102 RepID=A0A167Y318_9HYPO|nr:Dienelactone hydrolase [Niveomyces insectorum RCEF 264]
MADSEYLAKPSGECCLKGHLHEGEPRGKIEEILGIKTYVATPSKPTGHILFYFPDVFGLFKNGQLVMDSFADAGFQVLGIDYFMGKDPIYLHRNPDGTTEPGFDFDVWKIKHQAFAAENLTKWVDAAKEKYGKPDTKYACVGYCFGAPYVCEELARGSVSAGAFAHPAFLKEHHFHNIKGPLFLSCAEVDQTFGDESRRKAVDILISEKKTFQVQLFSGVVHGFALRGDVNNPYERFVKEQSLDAIAKWSNFWLSK